MLSLSSPQKEHYLLQQHQKHRHQQRIGDIGRRRRSCSCDNIRIMDDHTTDDERLMMRMTTTKMMMFRTNMTTRRRGRKKKRQEQNQKLKQSTDSKTNLAATSLSLSTILAAVVIAAAATVVVVVVAGESTTNTRFVVHGFQPSTFLALSTSSSMTRSQQSGNRIDMMFGSFNNGKSKNNVVVVPSVENKDYIRKNGLIRGHVKRTYPIRFNHKKVRRGYAESGNNELVDEGMNQQQQQQPLVLSWLYSARKLLTVMIQYFVIHYSRRQLVSNIRQWFTRCTVYVLECEGTINPNYLNTASDDGYDDDDEDDSVGSSSSSSSSIDGVQPQQKKYYVGSTLNRQKRYLQHFSERGGSEFTRKYRPLKVVHEIRRVPQRYVLGVESQVTAELMIKHGVNNVRGSYFCKSKEYTLEHKSSLVGFLGHYNALNYRHVDCLLRKTLPSSLSTTKRNRRRGNRNGGSRSESSHSATTNGDDLAATSTTRIIESPTSSLSSSSSSSSSPPSSSPSSQVDDQLKTKFVNCQDVEEMIENGIISWTETSGFGSNNGPSRSHTSNNQYTNTNNRDTVYFDGTRDTLTNPSPVATRRKRIEYKTKHPDDKNNTLRP